MCIIKCYHYYCIGSVLQITTLVGICRAGKTSPHFLQLKNDLFQRRNKVPYRRERGRERGGERGRERGRNNYVTPLKPLLFSQLLIIKHGRARGQLRNHSANQKTNWCLHHQSEQLPQSAALKNIVLHTVVVTAYITSCGCENYYWSVCFLFIHPAAHAAMKRQ